MIGRRLIGPWVAGVMAVSIHAMTVEQSTMAQMAREVSKLFVILASIDKLLAPILELVPNVPPLFAQAAEAFCSNVRSVVSTAGVPYVFALAAAHVRRYQLFYCAAELEAFLALPETGSKPALDTEEAARMDAERRTRELGQSRTGREALNYDACHLLLELGKTEEVADSAAQLILQATVLTWGAFEVLSREVFRVWMNRTPRAYANLLADSDVRRRFDLSRISIERVAEYDFDLSGRLGDLLIEQNDLADLACIKATFFALFPADSGLRIALNERALWLLFQRRNLIVHRRGIIDGRYLEASGDRLSIGSRLGVQPTELKDYLKLVIEAARALISIGLISATDSPGNAEPGFGITTNPGL
jgi:hypothetical protein